MKAASIAIDKLMPILGRAVARMEEPAVEKISEDSKNDAFQVLISTMLSAQTKDAVTHAASMRLFAVAKTPTTVAALTIPRLEKLIYPVSFYRNKAVHLKETCKQLTHRFGGRVPSTMEELLTLPGLAARRRTSCCCSRTRAVRTSASTPRAPHLQSARWSRRGRRSRPRWRSTTSRRRSGGRSSISIW
jgi:hypothetical protein